MPLDDDTKAASVRLFGWIVGSTVKWPHSGRTPRVLRTRSTSSTSYQASPARGRQPPNGPSRPCEHGRNHCRPYADLFPRRHILADDFTAALDSPSVWSNLEQRGLPSNKCPLHPVGSGSTRFFQTNPFPRVRRVRVEHTSRRDTVKVTNVAFLTTTDIGVLPRVRQSRKAGTALLGFPHSMACSRGRRRTRAAQETMCVCESPHRYYPAAWLVPVVRNQWVPLERRRTDLATAHSLGNLVRDSEWSTDLLRRSAQIVALLKGARGRRTRTPQGTPHDGRPSSGTALDKTHSRRLMTSVGSDWGRLTCPCQGHSGRRAALRSPRRTSAASPHGARESEVRCARRATGQGEP